MILTLKSSTDNIQHKYLIKFKYSTIPYEKNTRDAYGRNVYISWDEYTTVCEMSEIETNKLLKNGKSAIIYQGWSHCSYKDTYNKTTGRNLAISRALNIMVNDNAIFKDSAIAINQYFNRNKEAETSTGSTVNIQE